MKPVTDTILLVEDRIAEILDSGRLIRHDMGDDGLPLEINIRAHKKYRFLVNLSTDLALFHVGRY